MAQVKLNIVCPKCGKPREGDTVEVGGRMLLVLLSCNECWFKDDRGQLVGGHLEEK